ncbi:acylneuraminate cytidylyltransferase [Roseibium marinum]|uniref:N-acylneuraminate cytidylyltransferase n=1 Tax=Roseibium marinum TaxID=281252 RepID=A0A2S3V2Y0_9HYPH|nr:acylneuraminate cytidylyltransferase [Roseibium marinum]POF34342.1 N-acylneuraminate cytidylyltransferase [Roseibium marinum]
MDSIAVIPARGGSVGLPGKNVRPLLGVPLVARCIEAARYSRHLRAVYVSTDDPGIAQVSKAAGAEVIIRPDDLSNSTASSESALLHALEWLGQSGQAVPEYLVFLQCTSPFICAQDIDSVLEKMVQKGAAAAFSVVEDHGFIWQEDDAGFALGITHDAEKPRPRRQDMKPRYRENGAIYAMRVADFLKKRERFCGPTVMVPVAGPAFEIDDQSDWDIVEAFLKARPRATLREVVKATIKAVVMDFDGVHTDDCVTVDQDGREMVKCSRRDGLGLETLRKRGVKMMILSKESNPVVRARADKLKMPVQNQIDDKLPVLDSWRQEQGLDWSEVAFIGNDVNDLECMKACALSFAPADAHDTAKAVATCVLTKGGGNGALREMCDMLVAESLLG